VGEPRDELTDDDLMRLFGDGDADAFDALFDRHQRPVYRFARMMLCDAAAAEDALQEVFLRVARARDRYRSTGRFRPWLLRIARNYCLNRLEVERARRALQLDDGLIAAPRAGPEQQATDREQAGRVRRALDELPERQREALLLHVFEGMPYREVAMVMDIPINTVKTLIHRARVGLARVLEDS
jgi:RNA polymerase sigma-70 factor (ECF subfamily)